jgi:streptomycin 6-kinase
VASEWGVELGRPFALSSYSFVAPAGDNAVLKVAPPDDDESDEEADALALWAGDGAVRLLRRDRMRRVLLIERARPGTDISDLPDCEATAIAVDVGLRLWRCADQPFRWIGDHVPRWLDSAERSNRSARDLIPLACVALGRSLDACAPRSAPPQHPRHRHALSRHRCESDGRRSRVRRALVPLEPLAPQDDVGRHRAAAGSFRGSGARR